MEDNSLKRRVRILVISGVLLFTVAYKGICQEISFREYGVKDGLPQSQAYIIFQDSRGFIWVSTRNGLSRFDGIDFVNYHMQDGLPSNLITSICEDSGGVLWALSLEGISEYTGNGFIYYPPGLEFSGLLFQGPPYPTDKPGSCYFLFSGWGDHLHRIAQFTGDKYIDYSSKFPALDTLGIREMYYDSASYEFLLTDSSNRLYSWKEDVLKRLPLNDVHYFYFERDRLLMKSGGMELEYFKGKFSTHQIDKQPGRPDISMSLYNSVELVKYFDGSIVTEFTLPFKSSSPFIDREGVLWFSSESNIFRLLSPAFSAWSESAMKMHDPWAVCFDKNGRLWLGSLFSDLAEFDGTNFMNRNDYIKAYIRNFGFYKGSRLLSNGEMWLSTGSGVLIWDGSAFTRLSLIPENVQICHIYEDPDDKRIMIGTDKGVYVITKSGVRHFGEFVPDKLGVIEGIVKDDEGFYWMSGHKGLYKFDGVNSTKVEDKILPKVYTYTAEKDRSGGIWISSEEGLFFKGKKDLNFRYGIPQSFNQPANTVKILSNSQLLVGRITDICLIDLDKFYNGEEDYYRLYDKTDGYPGAETLDNGIVTAKNGSVCILTSENLVKLNPELLKKNSAPPSIRITGLYFQTDSLTWEPVRSDGFYYGIPSDIKLKRDEFRIKITFTGISTPNPEKVKYQYMLKGIDNKWSLPFNRREVVFLNLQPGEYSFLLKGINADGAETIEPLTLKFTISPGFMETNLFRGGMLIILLSLTVLITIYLLKRKQHSREERQKLKTELLRLQMNSFLKEFDPHFTFNAISSVGSLIMKNDRKAAYLYLTRLSALLRASLRNNSSIIKPLSEELDFVRNYCELQKLRFGERFNYDIFIGDGVDLNKDIPKMTIQTFVENAIKHGIENRKNGGKIDIILSHEMEFHKIIVRDNGIGRIASKDSKSRGTGFGIKTIARIFEIINRNNSMKSTLEISDISNNEFFSGTEVVITLPDSYSFRIDELSIISSADEIDFGD